MPPFQQEIEIPSIARLEFYFSIIYGIILPIDYIIFFKMVETTNQMTPENHGGHPKTLYPIWLWF
jgi:hypothetical protein